MRPIRLFVAVCLVCVAGLAQAATGSQVLTDFYNKVNTLSANFQQVQRDDNGNIVQQASGTFLLSRPNKFRWTYDKPYKQIIVSNGKLFKFYDVDLAQVTVRKVGATLNATPALLLTGGEALSKAFNITDSGRHDGLQWVHLTPKSNDTDFNAIDLGMQNNVPSVMRLHDNLGQVTTIQFKDVKVNPSIPASRFTLNVPKNVEVVDGRAGASNGNGAN